MMRALASSRRRVSAPGWEAGPPRRRSSGHWDSGCGSEPSSSASILGRHTYVPRVDRLVGEFRPHVTHTHMAKAGAIVRTAARRNRVPAIVHTFHGHVLEGYFSKPVARTFLEAERRLARITDVIVAVAPQIRDELLRLGVGRAEQWRVITVGVDLDPILAANQTRTEARGSLGWVDRPTIGIVGRLAACERRGAVPAGRRARGRPVARRSFRGCGRRRTQGRARVGSATLLGTACCSPAGCLTYRPSIARSMSSS